eukprot:3352411-Rhodomonas_salina.1
MFFATDIDNMFLPYKAGSDITCWEAWHGKPPSAIDCPTWGCKAYVFIERKRRKVSHDGMRSGGKFGDTTLSGTFLGFAHRIGHKGYMVLLDNKRTIVISTHVTFNEGVFPFRETASGTKRGRSDEVPKEVFGERLETMPLDSIGEGEFEIAFTDEHETEIDGVSDEQAARVRTRAQSRVQAVRQQGELQPVQVQPPLVQPAPDPQPIPAQPPAAVIPPPPGVSQYFDEDINLAIAQQFSAHIATSHGGDRAEKIEENVFRAMLTMAGDPQDYPESQGLPDAVRWQAATDSEMGSMDSNEVFDWVEPEDVPAGEEIVSTRMVYTKKLDKHNVVKKYKCRWVARDMFRSLEFNETYSPTAHPVSVQALIAISQMKGFKLYTSDVRTAYLNAKLEKPVYVYPPKGFERGRQLMRLRRALYGLKISAKAWHQTFVTKLKAFGFKVITNDECMFTLKRDDGSELHILIVVDDILQATNSE